jgi:hypothetical protein
MLNTGAEAVIGIRIVSGIRVEVSDTVVPTVDTPFAAISLFGYARALCRI